MLCAVGTRSMSACVQAGCGCTFREFPITHAILPHHAGKFPFGDPAAANGKHGVQNMIAKIMKVHFDEPEGLSPDLEQLLRSVLVSDPAARPSVQQLLAHPWASLAIPPGMLQCNDKARSVFLALHFPPFPCPHPLPPPAGRVLHAM